jgi:iron(III)-enterobactin esterase
MKKMAKVLAAEGCHFQFVFARYAGHISRNVKQETMPEPLELLWHDYQPVAK